jgi:hypothetical protein
MGRPGRYWRDDADFARCRVGLRARRAFSKADFTSALALSFTYGRIRLTSSRSRCRNGDAWLTSFLFIWNYAPRFWGNSIYQRAPAGVVEILAILS